MAFTVEQGKISLKIICNCDGDVDGHDDEGGGGDYD
jgi:hypothetical protein